jgi:eukaryotic-like serine/threonine-protein kinase
MSEVKPGDVLAGKFRIDRVLGQGGMGVVVAAHHLHLDERVAIKFLLPNALNDGEAVARFAREARAAVKIKSEHVARVSDVGTLETGSPYMVMEYLDGRDLSQLLQQRGVLSVEEACDYLLQACEALAEAHALGIVHRDLKPANLFLIQRADGSPCIKVLDFGISKVMNPNSGHDYGMTRTQAVMGSPLYMSPEQMASTRDVDARTDIWAIGAILYELVTGKVPFDGDTMPQLVAMILQQQPIPPRSRRADLPVALEQVILHCLHKDRTQRFQNVAELAHAITPLASPSSAPSALRISKVLSAAGISSPSHPSSAISGVGVSTGAAWGQTSSNKRSAAPWLIAAAVLLLVLGAGAAFGAKLLRSNADLSTEITSVVATTPPPAAPTPTAVELVRPTAEPSVSVAPATSAAPPEPVPATASPKPARPAAPRPAVKPTPRPAPDSPKPTAKPALDPLEGRR